MINSYAIPWLRTKNNWWQDGSMHSGCRNRQSERADLDSFSGRYGFSLTDRPPQLSSIFLLPLSVKLPKYLMMLKRFANQGLFITGVSLPANYVYNPFPKSLPLSMMLKWFANQGLFIPGVRTEQKNKTDQ